MKVRFFMKIINLPRGQGKTTRLLYASEFNDAPILCHTHASKDYLKSSRPTAVNLMWAVDKQMKLALEIDGSIETITNALIENGIKLENEDIEINKKMVYV